MVVQGPKSTSHLITSGVSEGDFLKAKSAQIDMFNWENAWSEFEILYRGFADIDLYIWVNSGGVFSRPARFCEKLIVHLGT